MRAERREHRYFVYIMSSITRVLHVGMTNAIERRVQEHNEGTGSAFAAKYRTKHLVYYDETNNVHEALAWEHSMKGWTRARKIALIDSMNPGWRDLSDDWTGTGADRL